MNTFQKQPEIQRQALQKALKSPLIGKHGKRRITLLKEEVYKEFQQKILEKAGVLFDAQMKLALKGNNGKPDLRAIDSLLNRAFGKPAQEIAISTPRDIVVDPVEKERANKAISDFLNRYKKVEPNVHSG